MRTIGFAPPALTVGAPCQAIATPSRSVPAGTSNVAFL